MPLPTTSSVHFDKVLTEIAIAYMQDENKLIANKVFPIVRVDKQSDRILKFSKAYWLMAQSGLRAPGTESKGIGFKVEATDTYFCDIHAFHIDIPEATIKNSDIPDLERQAVQLITWHLLLERERDWVANFFDDTGKTPETDFWSVEDDKNWTNEDSDPIADIEEAKAEIQKLTGFVPNVLVLGPETYNVLRSHPKIQAQVVYAPTTAPDVKGLVTPDLLAKLFDLDAVYVGRATYADIKEGEEVDTSNGQFVFGPHALLVYAPPRPGLLVPTGGYIFAWTGYNSGYEVGVAQFEMPHLKAWRYEAEMAYDAKLLGPDLGVFFKNVAAEA